ncbi:MAG: hypothetical protein OIF55_19095, partial [Amphritea sp.]|nr:hypothetical protein [Amphritea sp.]
SAQLGDILGGSLNINNRFRVADDGIVTIESSDGSMKLDVLNNQFLMNDAQGGEAVLIGDDGAGNRVVRVSKDGKSTTLTPDLQTLIKSGTALIKGRNADGSIGVAIPLGDTYQFDDLEVIISRVGGKPAMTRHPHWISNSAGYRVYSLYSYLSTGVAYFKKGGTTTNGRRQFDTYTGAKGGAGSSYVADPIEPFMVWDRGNQTEADEVFISAWWGFDAYASGWHSIVDCHAGVEVQYQILARNYGG